VNGDGCPISRRSADIAPFLVMEVLERAQALEREGREIIHLEVDPGQIVVTSGTSPAMLLLFGALLDPGDEIRQRLTTKTKGILVNSPANPTGNLLPAERLAARLRDRPAAMERLGGYLQAR